MASVNKVILIGNLTRDPQLKFLPSQTAVCEFGIAMNRKWRTSAGEERDEVCFVDCAAFGKAAETLNQYVKKGQQIYLEGRLKFDSWEDKQTGQKRNKLLVIVENFQFLGSRQSDGSAPESTGPAAAKAKAAQPMGNPIGDEQNFAGDDIPFDFAPANQ
jgi:single-strand DNA-binding protein